MSVEFACLFVAYIVLGTLIAILSRKFFLGTLRDYYTTSGRLGAVVFAGTYAATTYSAFMMIGLVGLTYKTGIGALGFELAYLAATMFLLSTVGYEIWRLSRERAWISPSQMIGDLYGSRALSLLVSVIYLFAMIPYLSAQVLGLKVIFSYGGLGEAEALLASLLLIYAWIVVAGVWSVALTDLYQGIIMLSSAVIYVVWILYFFIPTRGTSLSEVFSVLAESGHLGIAGFWRPGVFIAYTLPWMFFAVTNPQVVVRLYFAKDDRSFRRGAVYFFAYGFAYTIIVVLVGLTTAGLTMLGVLPRIEQHDMVTPYLLGLMHPLVGSLVAVSIIAAAVSTANSIVLAVSGSIISSIKSGERLWLARILDAALVTLAGLVAFTRPGFIVDLSVLTSVILLPLAPVTILGIYFYRNIRKATKVASKAALIAGSIMAVAFAVKLGPRGTLLGQVLGIPISAWILATSTTILLTGYFADSISGRWRPY